MQSVDEIWPIYVKLQKKNFLSKNMKNMTWKLIPGPF